MGQALAEAPGRGGIARPPMDDRERMRWFDAWLGVCRVDVLEGSAMAQSVGVCSSFIFRTAGAILEHLAAGGRLSTREG